MIAKMILMLACLVSIPLETKEAKVTPLMSKDLTEFPGKEGVMITVEYPPGSMDPIHRHNAHAFVYVLEGSIVMQVRGGEEVTLTAGQTFYEGPNDVHVVGRNASQAKPAKFVVFLVKDKSSRACRSRMQPVIHRRRFTNCRSPSSVCALRARRSISPVPTSC